MKSKEKLFKKHENIREAYKKISNEEREVLQDLFAIFELSDEDMLEVLKGGHTEINDDGKLYNAWKSKRGTECRDGKSSHQSHDSQFSIAGPFGREFLFGTRYVDGKLCTWFQFESHSTAATELAGHMISFAKYRATGRNQGPYGSSKYTEASPLHLHEATKIKPEFAKYRLESFLNRDFAIQEADRCEALGLPNPMLVNAMYIPRTDYKREVDSFRALSDTANDKHYSQAASMVLALMEAGEHRLNSKSAFERGFAYCAGTYKASLTRDVVNACETTLKELDNNIETCNPKVTNKCIQRLVNTLNQYALEHPEAEFNATLADHVQKLTRFLTDARPAARPRLG